MKPILGSLALALLLAVAGCSSSNDTTVVNRLVSPQQQKTDLKRALDAGAITQQEYEQELKKVDEQ